MGGKYSYSSCEWYSIEKDVWKSFNPMFNPRHGSTATLLNKENYIYVVGGYPLETSSTLIERFSFATETWEQVHIKLPIAAINNALFPINDTTLAVMSGKYTHSVFLIAFNEF